jgi:hypothetical protein
MQEISMKVGKKRRYIVGVIAVLVIGVGGWYLANQPPSIEYLKEHPEELRFSGYDSLINFQNVLQVLFPKGTSRSEVEEILIDHAKLQSGYRSQENGNYLVTYFPKNKKLPSYVMSRFLNAGLHQAQFEYDSNDRVVSIKSHIIDGKTLPRFFIGEPIKKGEKL